MGFRFGRTIRIMPGVRLNVGKRGVSASVGVRGAHVTVGKTGVRKTVGIPGTGASWTSYQAHGSAPSKPPGDLRDPAPKRAAIGRTAAILIILSLLFVAYALSRA